jgi:hypothetical protein
MDPFRILSFSLLWMPFWAFSAAHARPFLYVSSFTHGGSARECLEGAKAALERSGFTRDLSIDYFDDQSIGGHVGGMLPDAPVAAKIECDQSIGVTALAVSGLDNELTYEKYGQLFEAKW